MTVHEMTRALERVASRQDGAFHHLQARNCGFSDDMIERRVHNGAFIRLDSGVYALPSAPSTWRRQYKAAELSLPRAGLGGLAACKVHALESFSVVRPELVVTYTTNHRTRLATVHRSDSALFTTANGFRVTTIAQTLCDIVARVQLDRWERAADGALLEGRVTVDDLQERRVRYERSRRPGSATYRALVDARLEDGYVALESELERALREVLELVEDCPRVDWQTPAPWAPEDQRVDAMIRAWGVILEADGRRWHARVADFERDRWRDNQAAAMGLRVMRFTHTHLTQRRREVAQLISAAGHAERAA